MALLRNVFLRASKTANQFLRTHRLSSSNACTNADSNTVQIIEKAGEDLDTSVDTENEFLEKKNRSVLEEQTELEDLSHIRLPTRPLFTFAAFANKHEVIKNLIDLGVDFSKIEKRKANPKFLLRLDYAKDVKPYISFLHDNGVPADMLGRFFTKNPHIFKQSLEDLQVRINYLESKRFTSENIARIISTYPPWLNAKTEYVDDKLGYFQKQFQLNGYEIRNVICKRPAIIGLKKTDLGNMLFLLKDVTQFTDEQCKELFLKQPYFWDMPTGAIQKRLDIMLLEMQVPLWLIVEDPSGLVTREFRLKERHLFLKELGRAQYDPSKPCYVSIRDIAAGSDAEFCEKVAKTSIETFNMFLKCF